MPQSCIDKIPHVFQVSDPLQESIKELWSIIQDGMCVSFITLANEYYNYNWYMHSFFLKTDQMPNMWLVNLMTV